jgi:aspartate carbamoyltransferase catalytic subunit
MKDLVSIRDLSKDEITWITETALKIKKNEPGAPTLPEGHRIASLFYEPSTRTRTSFDIAQDEWNMRAFGFSGTEATAVRKGESLKHTGLMYQVNNCEAVVLRHPLDGSARWLADSLSIPVISGGDGKAGHPTQTLLDLATMEELGGIDGKNVAIMGDLCYGRTVHSLLQGLENFECTVYGIAPSPLRMPQWRVDDFERAGGKYIQVDNVREVIGELDFLMQTRIQRERLKENLEATLTFGNLLETFKFTPELMDMTKDGFYLLHPMPIYKIDPEIDPSLDDHPKSKYVQQAGNARPTRRGILLRTFSDGFETRKIKNHSTKTNWEELPVTHGQKIGDHLVYRLENGTNIDRIPHGIGQRISKLLGLYDIDTTCQLNMGISSKSMSRKDVINIHGIELSESHLRMIGLLAPNARVNYIQGSKVVKKGRVSLPDVLTDVIYCPNDNCISDPSHMEHVPIKVYVESDSEKDLRLRCHYCETAYTRSEMKFIEKSDRK